MTETTQAHVDRWQGFTARGDRIDVVNEMMRLTQDIIVRTMFSTDLGADAEVVNEAWPIVNHHIGQNFWSIGLERWLPTASNRRARRALADLDAVVYRIIHARRRAQPSSNGDLLSMLLCAGRRNERDHERQAAAGRGHDDAPGGARDDVACAVVDVVLLSMHPEIRTRLTRSARRARWPTTVVRRPGTFEFHADGVRRNGASLSARLGLSRQALGEDRLSGYPIEKGHLVFVIPFVIHRRPSLWPDPERFDPDRFSPERSAGRHRFACVPFGGGPRQCIGNQFAVMEATIILAMISQRYRLDLVKDHPVEPHALITLRPRYGVKMTVQPAS